MALAHQMHRHGGRTVGNDEAAYAAADVAGVEGVAAGSVTSFVRKLFQMVQGECDSVVGFVADGTAFEVKDPRRLEQDILPKYFRHSRFQSLVRQLNFYSFKKISKERSVWIYKHAFFRRDEPELLHALKRKTNQHGARIGGIGDGEEVGALERPRILSAPRSLSREVHDNNNNNKPRPRAPSNIPRHTPPFSIHNSPSSFSNHARQHQSRPPHLAPPLNKSSRPHHTSNSRSAGGGPSTGGVGGAAAPCYGSGRGPLSRVPGLAWSGAGGRPVSAGGAAVGSSGEYRADSNMHAPPRGSLSHRCSGGSDLSSSHGRPVSSQAYRQGPAIGDSGDAEMSGPFGGRNGGSAEVKRSPANGAGASPISSDREQALAVWGLSALCQVASATDAPGGHEEDVLAGRRLGGGGGQFAADASVVKARSSRVFDNRDRRPHKRVCTATDSAVGAPHRLGWGRGGDGGNEGGYSDGDEEAEEDGITSADRDDSSASFRHSCDASSNSSCGSSTSSKTSEGALSSSHSSPTSSPARGGDVVAVSERHNNLYHRGGGGDGGGPTLDDKGVNHRMSGSGGVFCPTWDWGRAGCEPALRLPGSRSSVDRRFERRVRGSGGQERGDDGGLRGMDEDEDDEESTKTEGEDVRDFHAEEERNGSDAIKAAQETEAKASFFAMEEEGGRTAPYAATAQQPRDVEADMEAEAAVGLQGIGALLAQFCSSTTNDDDSSDSACFAAASSDGDVGLREMSVFCAGPAGRAPDMVLSPAALACQVSSFLQREEAVARDLRVYAEALDPAAAEVVVVVVNGARGNNNQSQVVATMLDAAKLLRIFCRYAACRLGRALEVATAAAGGGRSEDVGQEGNNGAAQHVRDRLVECRCRWWRAAVRFS